jgi:hypothetical protein
MKTNLFNIKHHARMGPGGYKCACCFDPPGKRKHVQRVHKQRINKLLDKLEDV